MANVTFRGEAVIQDLPHVQPPTPKFEIAELDSSVGLLIDRDHVFLEQILDERLHDEPDRTYQLRFVYREGDNPKANGYFHVANWKRTDGPLRLYKGTRLVVTPDSKFRLILRV